MSDRWNFYSLHVDDQPASIMLDMGIAADAPVPGFPILGLVDVTMRQPRPDGLSSQEEFEALCAIGDALSAAAAQAGMLYVGRLTSDGRRCFYFHMKEVKRLLLLKDRSWFDKWAQGVMAAFPSYEFTVRSRPDPQWVTYRDVLYPDARDQQRMADRDLVEQLVKNGDHPDQPRSIDHRAYFPTPAARDAFAKAVVEQGWTIAGMHDDAGDFALDFVRVDAPDKMSVVSIALIELAGAHGGDYDGWGCEVV